MQQLHDLYHKILNEGTYTEDRTGTGVYKLLGQQMRFDLQKGFPAVTTKRLAWKAMTSELLWFIEGSSNERRLCEILHGTRDEEKETIWTDNFKNQARKLGYTDGELGPVYGKQWREWDDIQILNHYSDDINLEEYLEQGYERVVYDSEGDISVVKRSIDQLEQLITGLRDNPFDRRHIISAWNVGEIDRMALPPCHCFAQFFVVGGTLTCHLYQRSADMFLGVPFNISSYALLTHMLAQVLGLGVGEFIWTGGDCHIYSNHVEQVKEQLSRVPHELPELWIDTTVTDIESFKMDSFKLLNYNPDATIKAPMAI